MPSPLIIESMLKDAIWNIVNGISDTANNGICKVGVFLIAMDANEA